MKFANYLGIWLNIGFAVLAIKHQYYPWLVFSVSMFFLCLGDKLKDEIIEAIKNHN